MTMLKLVHINLRHCTETRFVEEEEEAINGRMSLSFVDILKLRSLNSAIF